MLSITSEPAAALVEVVPVELLPVAEVLWPEVEVDEVTLFDPVDELLPLVVDDEQAAAHPRAVTERRARDKEIGFLVMTFPFPRVVEPQSMRVAPVGRRARGATESSIPRRSPDPSAPLHIPEFVIPGDQKTTTRLRDRAGVTPMS
jgi:hypothetical protein